MRKSFLRKQNGGSQSYEDAENSKHAHTCIQGNLSNAKSI